MFWRRRESFRHGVAATLAFLGKWLLLAFFLESLMSAYIPAEAVGRWLGSGAWYEVSLGAAGAIAAGPLYAIFTG